MELRTCVLTMSFRAKVVGGIGGGRRGEEVVTHTWTFPGMISPLGARGAPKSVSATKSATTKAVVVNSPKVFCTLVSALYIVAADSDHRGQSQSL